MLRPLPLLPVLLAAGAATPILPGRWVTTTTVLDASMPGAPPQVAAMMKGRPTTVTSCIAPADAANGPRALAEKSNGRCSYTQFSMAAGRLNTAMSCKGDMTARLTGSYTPTSLSLDGTMTGAGGMIVKMHTEGRRVGAC
ncbi:DUF3617 domain-containing protein [uncultured Sphingomonas sp.]|uniref:DUF3617 domain-containing protein n=1 Tax=uncultured Sphingomonas sp. TaxID=158754 RepID=UPI0035C9EE98